MVKKWVIFLSVYLPALLLMAGCSHTRFSENARLDTLSLATPPGQQLTAPSYLTESPALMSAVTTHPDLQRAGYGTRVFYSSDEPSGTKGCHTQDRFDSKSTLAYYSEDHKKRLSLHTGGLSEAVVRFSVKLPSGNKVEKEDPAVACLYPSRVQGFLGSVYNEMYRRDGKNALDEAADRYIPWR